MKRHPRGDRVGGHIPARGETVFSGALDLIKDQAWCDDGYRAGGADPAESIEALDDDGPTQELGQNDGGQVHGVQSQAVSGLVAEAVNAVECADHISRWAATGDQDQTF